MSGSYPVYAPTKKMVASLYGEALVEKGQGSWSENGLSSKVMFMFVFYSFANCSTVQRNVASINKQMNIKRPTNNNTLIKRGLRRSELV